MAYVSENHVPESSEHQTIYTSPPGDVSRRGEARTTDKTTLGVLTGGASLEVIGGAAAVVLAIIALTGTLPFYLTAIATICVGGALLSQGAAIGARWRDTVQRLGGRTETAEMTGGIAAETLGGACGVVLGILALANVYPLVLLPIAALVFGGTMLIGSPAQAELGELSPDRDRRYERIEREAMRASGGMMALVGIGGGVLGLLALIHVGPALTLAMVAMLVFGGGVLLSGGALATKFGRRLAHVS